jgi:hypothetical protein
MAPVLDGTSICLDQTWANRRALDLETQEAGTILENPTQGFNLLQISPNCFLGIGPWTLAKSGPKLESNGD